VVRKTSVLIIQHGHGQNRSKNDSERIKYCDIFRSTCLLEQFRGYHVTWITDRAAEDLFLDNHLIDQLILDDHPIHLPPESIRYYDVVINLESEALWCELASKIPAAHRYGFLKTDRNKSVEGQRHGPAGLGHESLPFQDALYNLIGQQWAGQHYVLGYQPRSELLYDVGINQFVAPGLTADPWNQRSWQSLYRQLRGDYDVSWPKAIDGIREYIEWLASCRVIVTGQNLGLYLALALKKRVVVLQDQKDSAPLYLYGHGIKLTSFYGSQGHRPAGLPTTDQLTPVETIPVDGVMAGIATQINNVLPAGPKSVVRV